MLQEFQDPEACPEGGVELKPDEADIEVLKSTLGVSFVSEVPWWFRLAGGGCHSLEGTAALWWGLWAVCYSLSVFAYSIYQVYVTMTGQVPPLCCWRVDHLL